MTLDEAHAILATATALDTRMQLADPQSTQARAEIWRRVLNKVPSQWAISHLIETYKTPQPQPPQPGQIHTAWQNRPNQPPPPPHHCGQKNCPCHHTPPKCDHGWTPGPTKTTTHGHYPTQKKCGTCHPATRQTKNHPLT